MLLLSKKIVNLLLVLMLINLPVLKAGEGVRKKLRAWNQLKNARVYLKTGQLEMGLLLLNHSIRAHPDLAESWYTRGVANFRLERHEEACRDWKKACGLEVGWCLGEEYAIAGKICP